MDDDHPDHFFPVHSACEYIAFDFFSFASNQQNLFGCCRADDSLVRSCADLYLAFETQYEIDVNRTRFPTEIQFRLQWKNKSHGAEAFQHVVSALPANTQTGGPEQPALFNKGWIRNAESKVFEADPEEIDIEEVTTFIFSFLRRKPSTANTEASPPGLETFKHYINCRFPRELQNILTEYLHPLGALGDKVNLEPLGVLLPKDWRDLLPSTTPWLHDLDFPKAFQAHEPPDEWDWERLVRMLAQADAFEPGGCMRGAPLGLRNRRRIWRMLADMEAPRGKWRRGGWITEEEEEDDDDEDDEDDDDDDDEDDDDDDDDDSD